MDLIMPRLGETVTEGLIVKWLKKEGDSVEKEKPVVEISTDKVETDIPASIDGTLQKIITKEGEKVAVGKPIAEITPVSEPKVVRPMAKTEAVKEAPKLAKAVLSPLVRRLAEEKNVNLDQVKGSGAGGRITKEDVLKSAEGAVATEAPKPAEGAHVEAVNIIRKQIAENMIQSQKSTAHVTAIVEADFTNIDKLRSRYKGNFKKQEGFSLTFLPFVAKATITVLQKMTIFNAELRDDQVLYKPDINLGIAVAINDGLIVPVIKKAQDLSLLELARAINDIATRARANKLKPDEVHEGTFTITNNGSFGSIIQTPIIVPGQSAILSLESITKRVKVIDDAIAIRKLAFVPLTYDHRLIDGALASQFLVELKGLIEEANFEGLPSN